MATKSKKSWQEKLLDSKGLPKVVTLKKEAQVHWHGKTMAIPAPIEVNDIMAKVPKGKLITIDLIRQKVAQKHGADIGCPLTSGIFAWISAYAAEEACQGGAKKITPWWRTLKSDGSLNEKYPGGVKEQSARLQKEGHGIDRSRKIPRVRDFEQHLARL